MIDLLSLFSRPNITTRSSSKLQEQHITSRTTTVQGDNKNSILPQEPPANYKKLQEQHITTRATSKLQEQHITARTTSTETTRTT